jgi:flagellar biogenesis protein FliO
MATSVSSAQGIGPDPMPSEAGPVVAQAPVPPQESRRLGAGTMPTMARGAPGTVAPEPTTTSGHLYQTVLMLGGVIGIILLAGAGFKKLARAKGGLLAELGAGGRAPAGVLEVLGRYPVSRGSTLVLLKLDRRILLTCQSAGRKQSGPSMTTLCEITEPEEVASLLMKTREDEGDSLAKKFEAMLSRQDAWPKHTTSSKHDDAPASPRPVLSITSGDQPDDQGAEAAPSRPTERQLSAALSILRTRVDSLQRQPLARGGRA